MKIIKKKLRKIVYRIFEKLPLIIGMYTNEEIINNCNWFEKLKKRTLFFYKLFPDFNVNYFFYAYNIQIANLFKDERIKNHTLEMWKKYFQTCDEEMKFFFTKFIQLIHIIDNDFSKMFLEFAANTKNKSYRYWICMDIAKDVYNTGNGFYNEYFNDRKNIFNIIAEENCFSKINLLKKTQDRTLCIICYMYSDDLHNSMQRVAVMLSDALVNKFDKIRIVSIESFSTTKKEKRQFITVNSVRSAKVMIKSIKKLFNNKVEVTFAQGKNYKERLQNALQKIYEFMPNVILDISDECSVISPIYSKDFLTYYFPIRGSVSSSSYNYILGTTWMFMEENKKFNDINKNCVKEWVFPEYVPNTSKVFTKKELGFNDNSFILVSTSNNFSNGVLDKICQLIIKKDNIIWIFVGRNIPLFVRYKYKNLINEKKIIEWGFENNLLGFYSACDVFLRDDSSGGSGATAIAAMQGLPVVLKYGVVDPMRWLGQDYTSLHTDDDIINEIQSLCDDSVYYMESQRKVLDRIKKATDFESAWNELFTILTN